MKPNAIIERFNTDDRGVSPVIGVILMVAITVILAAVIGTFVLDLGQSAGNSAPSASLTVDADTGTSNMTISHKGGDAIQPDSTRILVESGSESATFSTFSGGDAFAVGDQATVNLTNGGNGLDWDDDGTNDVTPDSGASAITGFTGGDQITVQVIDTESQRVIFETTITA